MLDIQALQQSKRAKKNSRRQALKDQTPEDLSKDKHEVTRPPTAVSPQPRKRAAAPAPQETQLQTSRRRHLVDEPSDENVEILGANENPHAPRLNNNFVMPDSMRDCLLLAKKIGNVDTLEKMDIYAHEGPKVLLGRGVLQRVTQMDECSEMMSKGPGYISSRTGLILSELATNVVAMDNLVACHRDLKEEAECKLSKSLVDLNGASDELQKVSGELQKVSGELQKVSDELSAEKQSFESQTVRLSEMEGKVSDLELELELFKARGAELERQLEGLSKDSVIAEYKASPDFEMEWVSRVLPYYDQGKSHVLRMAAASGASSFQLFQWGRADHYSEAPRSMHHLVPFSAEELDILKQREPDWSPPVPIAQNIPYLLQVAKSGGVVEMTPHGWKVQVAEFDEESGEMAEADESDPPAGDV